MRNNHLGNRALDGRIALVTGASRGIGRSVALVLDEAGAKVHAVARTRSALDELARETGTVVPHVCDLTDRESVSVLVSGLLAGDEMPDVLVSNAGLFAISAVAETSPDLFEATLHANLMGPFRLLHSILPHMRSVGRGDIVTIGSIADRTILSGNGAYSASKFGARALHEVLRAELSGSGVRCTLVSPAATDTPIWDPVDPDHRQGFTPRSAMLRPSDVAGAVLWSVTRPGHVNIDELRLSHA